MTIQDLIIGAYRDFLKFRGDCLANGTIATDAAAVWGANFDDAGTVSEVILKFYDTVKGAKIGSHNNAAFQRCDVLFVMTAADGIVYEKTVSEVE